MKLAVHSALSEARRWLAQSPAACWGTVGFCAAMFLLVLGPTGVVVAVQERAESEEAVYEVRARTKQIIVGPEGKPFSMPSDAAVGLDGNLYVLDGVHHRVVVYDAEGKFRFEFGNRGSGLGQLLFPLGIATAPDGKVYVADSGNHRFQVFTPKGKPLEAVVLPMTWSGSPPDPTDVAVDPIRQRLYIADNDNHRLCLYNLASGSFEAPFGSHGLDQRQFRFPFLIDISPEGYVLVAEVINTRVQVLNSSGKFVAFIGGWGGKPGQLFRPKGVAISEDRVFVTDSYLGRVQVFDLRGSFFGVLADTKGAPMQFTTPTGIAIDVKNRYLYVVELKANRISRMELE